MPNCKFRRPRRVVGHNPAASVLSSFLAIHGGLLNRKLLYSAILRAILLFFGLALVTSAARASSRPASSLEDAWLDIDLRPELVDWFNQTARPGDVARVDYVTSVGLLDEITVGHKLVVFKSATLAEQLVPRIADKLDMIAYNLEHGPLNPLDEQADPVGSVQRMRALADRYGMPLALGPDHEFALQYGAALAPYVDIFVLQVQRVQTEPEVVHEFVVPLVEELRQANGQIKISVQVRTEGDVVALVDLIESLQASLDGISILTSPETIETAKALVTVLRPRIPEMQVPAVGQSVPLEQPETNPAWFLIIPLLAFSVVAGVIVVVVLGLFAMMVWLGSNTG